MSSVPSIGQDTHKYTNYSSPPHILYQVLVHVNVVIYRQSNWMERRKIKTFPKGESKDEKSSTNRIEKKGISKHHFEHLALFEMLV